MKTKFLRAKEKREKAKKAKNGVFNNLYYERDRPVMTKRKWQ